MKSTGHRKRQKEHKQKKKKIHNTERLAKLQQEIFPVGIYLNIKKFSTAKHADWFKR